MSAWTRNATHERNVQQAMLLQGFPRELVETLRAYQTADGLHAFVNREPAGGRPQDPMRWHISIQGPGRVPTWEELAEAAHALRPGVCFTMGLPPRSWWLNVHPNVLHLWETTDEALVEEYRANARGDAPT